MYIRKPKKERQKWWKSLTPDEQAEYIENINAKKAAKRRKETLRTMKKYGKRFSCSTCYHRKTESCTDDLPNGCGYYFDPITGKRGPKLEAQSIKIYGKGKSRTTIAS